MYSLETKKLIALIFTAAAWVIIAYALLAGANIAHSHLAVQNVRNLYGVVIVFGHFAFLHGFSNLILTKKSDPSAVPVAPFVETVIGAALVFEGVPIGFIVL